MAGRSLVTPYKGKLVVTDSHALTELGVGNSTQVSVSYFSPRTGEGCIVLSLPTPCKPTAFFFPSAPAELCVFQVETMRTYTQPAQGPALEERRPCQPPATPRPGKPEPCVDTGTCGQATSHCYGPHLRLPSDLC